MRDVNRVPASAGAEWLLGGFALLRKSPLGLGLMGALYGAITLLATLAVRQMTLFFVIELALALLGPVFMGGLVYAAREVDQGRSAHPRYLVQGLRDGSWPRLLATLLPQLVAMLLVVALLAVLLGPAVVAQFAEAVEKAQGQAAPDPSLFQGFPFGRFALWMLLALVIGILAGFFTFVGLPEIALTPRGAWDAMLRSFRACLRNLPAIFVFFVLAIIAAVAMSLLLMIFTLLVGWIAGDTAAQVLPQLVLMAVLMPVVAGAVYVAWKQLLGPGTDAVAPPAPAAGFEA